MYKDGSIDFMNFNIKEEGKSQFTSAAGKTLERITMGYSSDTTCYVTHMQLVEGAISTDFTPYQVIETSTPVNIDSNHTIFANWKANEYTVTFNANGHGTAPAAQTVTEGQTAVKPADLTADGYTFGGWFTDQACTCPFDFNTPITKDLVLYAKWTNGRNVPRTGDPNNTGLWVSLMGLSILLISGAIITYRKRRTR